MRINPIINPYYTKQTVSTENKKQLAFSGVGLYDKNDSAHTPTKEDLAEINKINQKRKPDKQIDPNHLFKTFEQYDKINEYKENGNYYLEDSHRNEGLFYEDRILLKSDLENISEDSPLYRFKYVQDLRNSKDNQDFYKKMVAQFYKGRIEHITDEVILNYIFGGNCCIYFANSLIDAINSCEGRYVPLIKAKNDNFKTFWGNFDLFLQARHSSTKEVLSENSAPLFIQRYAFENNIPIENIKKDIELKIKYKKAEHFCRNRNMPDKIKNHLYENYYLKNIKNDIDITDEEIELCKQINKKYGTKLLLSSETTNLKQSLNYIEKELSAWKKAGGDSAVYPKTIDFSLAQDNWYNHVAGTAYMSENRIKLAGSDTNVKYALRHEIMHLNQNNPISGVFEEIKDGKYRDEFKKAGIISPSHIDYAHTDEDEYVAVAAEGDMSEYSDEFKEVLIELGMPEWVFELDNV